MIKNTVKWMKMIECSYVKNWVMHFSFAFFQLCSILLPINSFLLHEYVIHCCWLVDCVDRFKSIWCIDVHLPISMHKSDDNEKPFTTHYLLQIGNSCLLIINLNEPMVWTEHRYFEVTTTQQRKQCLKNFLTLQVTTTYTVHWSQLNWFVKSLKCSKIDTSNFVRSSYKHDQWLH